VIIQQKKLLVTCLNSKFHVFDNNVFDALPKSYPQKNSQQTIWCGRHLPQEPITFATTGQDGTIDIYRHTNEGGHVKFVSSTTLANKPITSFEWNQNKAGLCIYSALDQTVRLGIFKEPIQNE